MTRKDIRRQRLELLCEEHGGYVAVAERARVSADNLWQILNAVPLPSGNPRGMGDALALKIEKAFGKPEGWMDSSDDGAGNVKDLVARRRVPLISWVQAGSFNEVADPYRPGEADEWIDVYDTLPSEQTFALRVTGDSMTSPNPGDSITFPDGTVIVVDPLRQASAGDFVIAKDVNTQRATFKKLVTDGSRWFLRPLNPSYPMIEIDDPGLRVIGKVIEYSFRRKL
jgi:SOS-response transcriptional repressor LexA